MNYKTGIIGMMVATAMSFLTGCGADWDQRAKEGVFVKKYMMRDIKVINSVTGERLKEFSAYSYISEESTNGDVTITYYDGEGQLQKLDILGNMAIVITDTKCESLFPKK